MTIIDKYGNYKQRNFKNFESWQSENQVIRATVYEIRMQRWKNQEKQIQKYSSFRFFQIGLRRFQMHNLLMPDILAKRMSIMLSNVL